MQFLEVVGNKYQEIIMFEADEKNYVQCEENVKKLANVKLYNKALWNKCEKLHFESCNESGRISDGKGQIVEGVALDEILQGKRVTFIKMDIEGAELAALQGARETIMKWHPKLAICLYHKPEDIVEITEYIIQLNPSYKIYIRQHVLSYTETILYACD